MIKGSPSDSNRADAGEKPICPRCDRRAERGQLKCAHCGAKLFSTGFLRTRDSVEQAGLRHKIHRGPTVILDEGASASRQTHPAAAQPGESKDGPRDADWGSRAPEREPVCRSTVRPQEDARSEPPPAQAVDESALRKSDVPASVPHLKRVAACLIDAALLGGIGAGTLGAVAAMLEVSPWELLRKPPPPLAGLLGFVALFKFAFFVTLTGQTMGMIPFRLRITDLAGSRPELARSLARSLVHLASLVFPVLFLVIVFRRDRRALSEVLSGTRTAETGFCALQQPLHKPVAGGGQEAGAEQGAGREYVL